MNISVLVLDATQGVYAKSEREPIHGVDRLGGAAVDPFVHAGLKLPPFQ